MYTWPRRVSGRSSPGSATGPRSPGFIGLVVTQWLATIDHRYDHCE